MSTSSARIAYIMSRFPKITETFILYEILALEERGVPVDVHPLLREREAVVHPEAQRLLPRIRFHPFLSLPILRANLHYALRKPGAYFSALGEVLRGTWGCANFFVGALGIFPKSVRFAWEMSRAGVTHVHAHFATHPAVAALVIHRLTGLPFSFTVHAHDLQVDTRMLGVKTWAAEFVVAISEYNRAAILAECGTGVRDRIHVVHCGVDTEVFEPEPRSSAGGPLRILSIARFHEVKGHRFLVEACRLLQKRGVDFRCDLVGEGPLRARIEKSIRAAGIADRVISHGARPRPEVVQLLAQADVLAQPSVVAANGEREGIPVSLMEAMATGLPVVASELSGIPELVQDGVSGLLVKPGDADALADALQRLAADPELRSRLGHAAVEKVRGDFDLTTNVARLAELLLARAAPASGRGT